MQAAAGPAATDHVGSPMCTSRNAPLFTAPTFAEEIPHGFRLIDELRVRDDRDFAYARLFEVLHDDDQE